MGAFCSSKKPGGRTSFRCDSNLWNDDRGGDHKRDHSDSANSSGVGPSRMDSMCDDELAEHVTEADNRSSLGEPVSLGKTDHLNLIEGKPDLSHVSERGVTIEALRGLLQAATGKPVGEELVKKVVKPITTKWRCSYADLLPKEQRGKVNIFVSHAWRYPFRLLVAALEEFERSNSTLTRPFIYFVDYCSINQHSPMADLQNLKSCIRNSQATVLVLSPWSDPIPLKRSWCIYEIMHTILSEATRLEVVLPPREKKKLLQSNLNSVDNVLAKIDSAKAEASVKEDQEAIRAEIVDDLGGFLYVNDAVLKELRKWLDATISQILEDWPASEKKGVGWSTFLNNAAIYFRRRAVYDKAIPLSREIVKLNEIKKQKPSRDAIISKKNLATALRSLAKVRLREGQKLEDVNDLLMEAENTYEECIALDEKYLNKSQSLKANLLAHSAELYEIMGNLEKAEKLCRAAVLGFKNYNEKHPNRVVAYCNLAQILAKRGNFDEAEQLYEKGIRGLRDALGSRHLWTLESQFGYSCVLLIRGVQDEKEQSEVMIKGIQMMRACHTGMTETLGVNHPETRECQDLLKLVEAGSINKDILFEHFVNYR